MKKESISVGVAFLIIIEYTKVTYLVISAGWTPDQTCHAFQLVANKQDRLR